MKNFAVLNEDNVVENIIIVESKSLADELTGKNCVEFNHDNPAHVGGTYDGSSFSNPFAGEERPPRE
jgi:hypothetical protein